MKKRIVVHCTENRIFADAMDYTVEQERQKINDMCEWWKRESHWIHCGYHAVIMPSGRIHVLCDPWNCITNGAAGYNKESIHVAYYGGYTKGEITKIQLEALIEYVRSLMILFNVNFENVVGHCELPHVSKDCPRIDMIDFRKHLQNFEEDRARIVSSPHYIL